MNVDVTNQGVEMKVCKDIVPRKLPPSQKDLRMENPALGTDPFTFC